MSLLVEIMLLIMEELFITTTAIQPLRTPSSGGTPLQPGARFTMLVPLRQLYLSATSRVPALVAATLMRILYSCAIPTQVMGIGPPVVTTIMGIYTFNLVPLRWIPAPIQAARHLTWMATRVQLAHPAIWVPMRGCSRYSCH